jgi:hypothetical protein
VKGVGFCAGSSYEFGYDFPCRCSVLSVSEPSEELLDLTRTLERLPAVQDLCQTSAICLAEADDPLFTFVKLVGLKYKSLQDIHRKSLFHEKCVVYFMQFDKCVSSVINCATSSSELVSRIYVCAACLVCHCGQIVYTKVSVLHSQFCSVLSHNPTFRPSLLTFHSLNQFS